MTPIANTPCCTSNLILDDVPHYPPQRPWTFDESHGRLANVEQLNSLDP